MSSHQTFQNENISVTLKREPYCRVHMEVIASPQAVQASRHKAAKNINKEISVPGFRKGKAPEAVVMKKYGPQIESEMKDILLNTSFSEALQLCKVFPFNEKSISNATVKNISAEEGATLSYDYEVFPEVPSIDPASLVLVQVEKREVGDKDVAQSIEDLRLQGAQWQEITDRPVQEGDFVDLDIDALGDSPRNICTNTRIGVMEGKMDSWMRKLIVGLTPGQEVEGMSEKPQDDCKACESGEEHEHHHHDFTPTLCHFKLHGIYEAKLPEADDALAKKFGATDYKDLETKLREHLKKRAEEAQQNEMRAQMEHTLLAKYVFDLPFSIVQGQVKSHKKDIINDLRERGISEKEMPTALSKAENELANKIDRDFRLYFLIQKAAKENKVEVSQEELTREWLRQMWYRQMQNPNEAPQQDNEESMERLRMQIISAKTLDNLLSKATLTPA